MHHGQLRVRLLSASTGRTTPSMPCGGRRTKLGFAGLHCMWSTRQVPHLPALASGRITSSAEDAARQVLETALQDPAISDLQIEAHMPSVGPTRTLPRAQR